jgi:hypothetical protein
MIMTTHLKRLLVLITAGLFSAAAFAAGVTTSKISRIGIAPTAPNAMWIVVTGPVTTPAACAKQNYFAINIATDAGKAVYKMALAAQLQNLPVTIYGTGSCYYVGEQINWMWYNPPTE